MEFSAPPSQTTVFPSIKQLFSESWNNLINKLLSVFIFNSIALGIVILTAIILIALLAGSVSLESILPLNNPILTSVPVLIILFVGIILGVVLFSIFHIGNVLILNSNSPQISYKSTFRTSFSLILPVIFGQLLVSLFVIGGLFLFILPGIIFSILFQFVIFSIILDKLGIKASLGRSVYLVSKSFGPIFVRLLILILIPVLFNMLLSFFSIYLLDEVSLAITNTLFSLFYSFFWISFLLTLFKQAKSYSGEGNSTNLRFIVLVSVIGWVLGAGLIIAGLTYLPEVIIQNIDTPLPISEEQDFVEDYTLDDDLLLNETLSNSIATNGAEPIQTSTSSSLQQP